MLENIYERSGTSYHLHHILLLIIIILLIFLHDLSHLHATSPPFTEHEACAMDIAELNWHVNYKGRAETRMSNRKDVAETLNTKLKADIEFVNKHM